jgi:hypothetical protein
MSKVFIPKVQEGVELFQPLDDRDYETINRIVAGIERNPTWIPIAVKRIQEDEGKKLRPSSCSWFGTDVLVFREDVCKVLGTYLTRFGSFLPLECPEAELYLFNPTKVLDALDAEASKIKRGDKTGVVISVESYIFRPKVVQDALIFKLPRLQPGTAFVSEEFVDLWCQSDLTGLDFQLIWDSSGPPITRSFKDQITGNIPVRKGKSSSGSKKKNVKPL